MRLLSECLAAYLAREWLLPCVCPHMYIHTVLVFEPFVANLAVVQRPFLLPVDQLVVIVVHVVHVIVVFTFAFLFLRRAPRHTTTAAADCVVGDVVDIDVVVYGVVDLYTLSVDLLVLRCVVVELVHIGLIVGVDVLQNLVYTLTAVAVDGVDDCTNVLVVQHQVREVRRILFFDCEHELVVVIVVVFEDRLSFQGVPQQTIVVFMTGRLLPKIARFTGHAIGCFTHAVASLTVLLPLVGCLFTVPASERLTTGRRDDAEETVEIFNVRNFAGGGDGGGVGVGGGDGGATGGRLVPGGGGGRLVQTDGRGGGVVTQ